MKKPSKEKIQLTTYQANSNIHKEQSTSLIVEDYRSKIDIIENNKYRVIYANG